jgi:predicted PurR-regulated permease PerM
VALTVSPWHGAAVALLYTVIQQLENYLIVPRVMSRAVSLHPLVVLVALMAGAELLGPSGAVLAVPLAATLAVLVDEARRRRLPRAGTATRPEDGAAEPDSAADGAWNEPPEGGAAVRGAAVPSSRAS